MQKQQDSEKEITSYLLGTLAGAENERLDELSVTDDEFARRLTAAENDLVDAYASGTLSAEEARQFESHYLASPRRREKSRFAHAFRAYTGAEKKLLASAGVYVALPAPGTSVEHRPIPGQRKKPRPWVFPPASSNLRWGLAAASLMMLFVVGYLAYSSLLLHQRVDQVQAERAALLEREQTLQQQLADERSAGAETEKQLASVRERLGELEKIAAAEARRAKNDSAANSGSIVALTLAAPLRGAGQPPTVQVPAGTKVLAITLGLDPGDFSAYDASLKAAGTGQVIWRSGRHKATAKDGSKTLLARLPAGLLKSENYTLDVTGVSAGGTSEMIGSYLFKVVRR